MKNKIELNQEAIESAEISVTYPEENKINQLMVDEEEYLYGYVKVEDTLIKAVEIKGNTYFKWSDISRYALNKINKKLNSTTLFKKIKLGEFVVGVDTETVNKIASKWVDIQGLSEMLRYLINKHKDKLLLLANTLGLDDNTVVSLKEAKRKIELINRDGMFYISTLDIAAETGKNHKDVLKKGEMVKQWSKFAPVD
ncbi:hypothetical protein PCV68_000980 [Staphylococcus pseudintermedius]|nr:hypothetical protein [Staphylococcus pseudintermedius]